MTEKQAIEAAIAIWTHVVETGEKPAYANQYRFKCPLCDLYNNQHIWDTDRTLRCLDCPLYDGITRSRGCCYEYDNWGRFNNFEAKHKYAQAMLVKLKKLLCDYHTI